MRKALLIFTDIDQLCGFLFIVNKGAMEVSTAGLSLSGFFSDDELVIACTRYKGNVKFMEPQIAKAASTF